jgi:hypothetical protein
MPKAIGRANFLKKLSGFEVGPKQRPPSDLRSRSKETIRLICLRPNCGNIRARNGVDYWTVGVDVVYGKGPSCPKCAKVQQMTKLKKQALCKGRKVVLQKNAPNTKDPHLFFCTICKKQFSTSWELFFHHDSRPCQCAKRAWKIFENEISNVFDGVPGGASKGNADVYLSNSDTVIEAKFGNKSFARRVWPRSKRQIRNYQSLGCNVIYLICAIRDEMEDIEEFRFPSKFKVYFLNEFHKVNVDGKTIPREKINFFEQLYREPFKFVDPKNASDLKRVRNAYFALCKKYEFLVPGHLLKKLKFPYSLGFVFSAYSIVDRKLKNLQVAVEQAHRASGQVPLRSELTQVEIYKRQQAYADSRGGTVANQEGKLADYSCGVPDHKMFPIRNDKLKLGRWCLECKKLKTARLKNRTFK